MSHSYNDLCACSWTIKYYSIWIIVSIFAYIRLTYWNKTVRSSWLLSMCVRLTGNEGWIHYIHVSRHTLNELCTRVSSKSMTIHFYACPGVSLAGEAAVARAPPWPGAAAKPGRPRCWRHSREDLSRALRANNIAMTGETHHPQTFYCPGVLTTPACHHPRYAGRQGMTLKSHPESDIRKQSLDVGLV